MIKAIYDNGAYYVMLGNLNDEGAVIPMKFDTGAVNTIISFEAYTGKRGNKERIAETLEGKHPKKTFYSASGNKMEGYLVCAENVMLSGMEINKLYYYLIMNVDYSVALLGDDFLSKCKFEHEIDSDIEIDRFDFIGYNTGMTKAITESELNELIEEFCIK